jgi:two-component system sensor histidine kinase KdpD
VGKTFAMLDEGQRRRGRGTDVVVGLVETHGRAQTAEKLEGLEVVPRLRVEHRGATFTELDVEAVVARRPEVRTSRRSSRRASTSSPPSTSSTSRA